MKTSILEKTNNTFYIDHCYTVMPNSDDRQEIYIDAKTFDGKEISLIFTPEDFLDTFKPSLFDRVRKSYIQFLEKLH